MTPIPGVPTFIWCPAPDAGGTITLRSLRAQFGDGYAQDAADGINNAVESWMVQFMGRPAKIGLMVAFLKERAGYRGFHWTPPNGELLLFVCKSLSVRQPHKNVVILAATFEQTFRA